MKDFPTIFNDLRKPLVYFAEKIISDRAQAEDIVADSFLKLWNKGGGFECDNQVKAWMYRTVSNASLEYLKQQKRKRKNQDGYEYWMDKTETHFLFYKTELLNEFSKMIEQLPKGQREICKLIYFEGLTTNEVAARLNLSPQTVRNQKAFSIKCLKNFKYE